MKKGKLNKFSKSVWEAIASIKPEWSVCTKNDPKNPEIFVLTLSSPRENNPNIEIHSENEEITLNYGFSHTHLGSPDDDPEEIVKQLLEMINDIMKENLVSYCGANFLGFIRGGGFVEKQEYQEMIDKKKIKKAVSWRGTYNFNCESI